VVLSQGAWTCQRSVRFDNHLCVRTYHDGYHLFPNVMLFDLEADPHEQENVAEKDPERTARGLGYLELWHGDMMANHPTGTDPLWTVIHEGGPFHVRKQLGPYLERLRATGRGEWAERLAASHPTAGG
jgi:hypothetical protein